MASGSGGSDSVVIVGRTAGEVRVIERRTGLRGGVSMGWGVAGCVVLAGIVRVVRSTTGDGGGVVTAAD